MSKRGSTRIPIFGPRSPVPVVTIPPPSTATPAPVPLAPDIRQKPHTISSKDIGKKVRVADKEGFLRFVGNVQFATGVWCGVELETELGKHNGCVRGVRYFACPEARGLMAPLSKASLIDEIAEDAVSGPYSIIFDVNDEPVHNDNTFSLGTTERPLLIRSGTYDKIETNKCRSGVQQKSIDLEKIKTQITCDRTIGNQNDTDNICNETVINISITNRGRVFSISHTDKEMLNISHSRERSNSPSTTSDLTNAVNIKGAQVKNLNEQTKPKVPSELNLVAASYHESVIKKNVTENFERPRSYPISENYFPPIKNTPNPHSNPVRINTDASSRKSFPFSPTHTSSTEDDNNKRDSLDCDESLGILTPDQMNGLSFLISRSPSSENIQSLPNDQKFLKLNVDSSIVEFSLLDINELSTFTMATDKTKNMELPLDTANKSLDFGLKRTEQTPSPEELPLDPTPVVDSEPKTEPSQSKTTSNFITSITSITSIDTGYQGDGEMSRPASRGPDNSPLTRRPLTRPQPRRPDPMTDSDFYTESDADNHEDHPLRGDRKAQVIDGTLYGGDPQAAADIYANNRENMDSSGIFTDLESNKAEPDVSPSDSSTKTISYNSQNNSPKPLLNLQSPDSRNVSDSTIKEMPIAKRHVPLPPSITSTPSVRSPRRTLGEEPSKKFTSKRNIVVTSKVKTVIESTKSNVEKKIVPKKTVGRWDAVMSKISKGQGEQLKNNLKEIKSKVFTGSKGESVKTDAKDAQNRQTKSPNNKVRRLRIRSNAISTPTKSKTSIHNSINSSLSDLSGASPVKKIGSEKKQRDVVRVTQVLTPAKLSPKTNRNISNANEAKKTTPPHDVKATNKKNLLNSKEKKKETAVTPTRKECNRTTVKGGRVSPGTRPPQQQRATIKAPPRTAEALAVLVQHLVFNLEAFKVPSLKKEVNKIRLDAEEAHSSCQQLEDKLLEVSAKYAADVEKERSRFQTEITALIEQHRTTVTQLKNENEENEKKLMVKIQTLTTEYAQLQKAHSESMEILREENDAIREEIDEKSLLIDKLQAYKYESDKLKKSYKEQIHSLTEEFNALKEQNNALINHRVSNGNNSIQEVLSLQAVLGLKQLEIQELRKTVVELTQKSDLLPAAEEKVNILQAKCEDLMSQLDRKNLCELQLTQEKEKLEKSLKEEVNTKRCLVQRNEELQWKLQQNKEVVNKVIEQAEEGSFNRSIFSASLNERHSPSRYCLERTLSFREKSALSKSANGAENTFGSGKVKDICDPTEFSKVKGVIEKSDSVSYVLEMDESPDVVADRIVRRSFRNTTPPKNTPTKSPSNKRPRMKVNPLSMSASASAVMSTGLKSRAYSNGDCDTGDIFIYEACDTSTPFTDRYSDGGSKAKSENFKSNNLICKLGEPLDIDEEHDIHVHIPSLPSEIGENNERQALPTPRHLAGETMIFESNSDDESTTSSSSGQL